MDLPELLDTIKAEALVKGKGEYFRDRTNSSNDIFVTCPRYDLHSGIEHTPSCSISKEEGIVHCFGCGWSTTVAGLVTHVFGYDTPVQGYQWILRHFSTPAIGKRPTLKLGEDRILQKTKIPEDILSLYNFDHPYMFRRGLTPEVLDWFSVGYDEESEALTLPMRDACGAISFIKKRPIKRTKFAKYIIEEGADKRDLVYGLFMIKRCISKVDMIYLSEGELDTLSWYCINRYGAGIQGADMFETQVKQLIRTARGVPVCLAFDNDKAGYICKHETAKKLRPYFPLYELVYPGDKFFKDPNDLLVSGRLDTCLVRPFRDL